MLIRKPKNEITKNKRNRSKSGGLEVRICNTNVWEVGVVGVVGGSGSRRSSRPSLVEVTLSFMSSCLKKEKKMMVIMGSPSFMSVESRGRNSKL